MQSAFQMKNSMIAELQLEKSDLQIKVKELEKYVADLKAEKEESKNSFAAKLEQLLQLEKETNKNKTYEKLNEKLKSKVKKWKAKYSAQNKRKRELDNLNREKDQIINDKNKNCDDLKQIVNKYEEDFKEKDVEIGALQSQIQDCILIYGKVKELNEMKEQNDQVIKDLSEKNKEMQNSNDEFMEKIQSLQSENSDLIELNEEQEEANEKVQQG